jgi:hypothetical protein
MENRVFIGLLNIFIFIIIKVFSKGNLSLLIIIRRGGYSLLLFPLV